MPPRPARILGAFVALWSAIAAGSPVPLHRCAMPMAAHAAARAPMEHAAHASHQGMHHAMSAVDETPPAPSDHHDDSDDDCCRCNLCCCAPAAVVLPTIAETVPRGVDVDVCIPALPALDAPRAERAVHLLPFANAPPNA